MPAKIEKSDKKLSPVMIQQKRSKSYVNVDQEAVSTLQNHLGRCEVKVKLLDALDLLPIKSGTELESLDENAEDPESEAYDRTSEDEEKAEEKDINELKKFEEAQKQEIQEYKSVKKCILNSEIRKFAEEKKKQIETEIVEVEIQKSLEADKEIEEFLKLKEKEATMFKFRMRLTKKLSEIEDMKAKTGRLVERRDGMNCEIERRIQEIEMRNKERERFVQERDGVNQEIESRNEGLQNLQDAVKELELELDIMTG